MKLDWLVGNPFVNFSIRFLKTERDILNKHELVAIEEAIFDHPCLEITKDMFVFSCYTGLSYIDIQELKLNRSHIVNSNDDGIWIRTKQ